MLGKTLPDIRTIRRGICSVNGRKEVLTLVTGFAVAGQLLLQITMRLNSLKLLLQPTEKNLTLCESIQVNYGSARSLVQTLGYSKICKKWIPRMFIDSIKEQRLVAS